ncbi:MAG: carotenoid oxygenase family protein [Phenylobacterium sp.]|nr:carotenoid oxygenase family protein [Phenylobacterium sp.]
MDGEVTTNPYLRGNFGPIRSERRAGLSYRHGWIAADTRGTDTIKMNGIAHYDLQTGRRQVWEAPAGDFVSEPVFTPRHADAPEGDGWLTAVVYRGAEDRSDFLVFEAQNVASGPIATAALPRRAPFGFHGNWVPA